MCYHFLNMEGARSPRWGATTKLVVALVVISVAPLAADKFRIAIESLTAEGDYRLLIGPEVTDLGDNPIVILRVGQWEIEGGNHRG